MDAKDMHWLDCDTDKTKGKEIENVIKKIANRLYKEGFSETLIYAFVHKTVDVALYEAEIERILGDEE